MPRRDDFDDDFLDDPNSDAFDYSPVTSQRDSGNKVVKLFVMVSVIAVLAVGGWLILGPDTQSHDNVPLVRADNTPTKTKPDNPGGMSVPNRDKTVYDRVSGSNTEPKLERLLPRPEKPMEKPVATLNLPEPIVPSEPVQEETRAETAVVPIEGEITQTEPVVELPSEPTEEMATEIEAPAPPPSAPNAPMALTKRQDPPAGPNQQDKDDLTAKIAEALSQPAPEPVVVEPVEAPKVAAVTPAPKPKAVGSYVLQLLSSKSESGVQQTWEKIKSKNGDILKTYKGNIVKADLGPTKGVYYRLRVGSMSDSAEAKRVCDQLKIRNVGCFIVKLR